MEQRALLAFVLSLAILVGYQALFAPTDPVAPGVAQTQPAPVVPSGAPAVPAPAVQAVGTAPSWQLPADAEESLTSVQSSLLAVSVTNFGGRIKSIDLAEYRSTAAPGSPALDLVSSSSALPLAVSWVGANGTPQDDRALLYEVQADRTKLIEEGTATLTLTARGPDGVGIRKTLTLHANSYLLDVAVELDSYRGPIGLGWARDLFQDGAQAIEGPTAFLDGDLETISNSSLTEPWNHAGMVSWAGYATHYFLTAFVPDQPRPLRLTATTEANAAVTTVWDDAANGRVGYRLFVGPKSVRLLDELGSDLDGAVDLGWFAVVARPLQLALYFIEGVVGNYGIAIILLTVAIRLMLWPINHRQMEAMKGMQRIQPEMKRLQERYKDDRDTLNKEMMELYRRHKVNPLSGCLPMVAQLPIFLGLYNVLMQAIELRHAPFFGWIQDLSQPDRLGTLAIPFVSPPGIPVLTILMGASMLVQQRMTPSTADPAQARMMMLMPVVFTVMFVNFPAGLVIYWFANNVLSIGQQVLTERKNKD